MPDGCLRYVVKRCGCIEQLRMAACQNVCRHSLGFIVQAVVSGKQDPQYQDTTRMVLEAAICLALQHAELKEKGYMQVLQSWPICMPCAAVVVTAFVQNVDCSCNGATSACGQHAQADCSGLQLISWLHVQGGVLTPATAMGAVLIKRLKEAGITFQITKTGTEVPKSPLDKLKSSQGSANKATGAAVAARAQLRMQQVQSFASVGMAHAHPLLRIAQRSAVHLQQHRRRQCQLGVRAQAHAKQQALPRCHHILRMSM